MKNFNIISKNFIFYLFFCLFLTISPVTSEATEVQQGLTYFDMNNWSKSGPSAAGTWTVESGGRTVTQSINGNATFFVSPDSYINQIIKGTIMIGGASDDDFVGFVMGYQEPANVVDGINYTGEHEFVLFDWKRFEQSLPSSDSGLTVPFTAKEGYTLSKAKGIFTNTKYTGGFGENSKYFWGHQEEVGKYEVLGTLYGPTQGWDFNKEYQFEILYTETQIKIKIDNVVIFDVSGSFIPGKIGFYNLSQNPVTYGNVKTAPSSPTQVAPVAKEDRYITSTNTVLTVSAANGILTNDYDPNLDNYSIVEATTTSHGALYLNADGSFTYTPDANYFGQDSFTYNLLDSTGLKSDTIIVYVNTIEGANVAPTDIIFDTNQIYSNSPNGTVVSVLSTTDSNAGDYHDYMLIDSSSGRFGIIDNKIIINDLSNISHGNYSITVRSTDLSGAYIDEVYNITVANLYPEISQGTNQNVRMSVNSSPSAFSLTLNATDEDDDTITWSISAAATHGIASATGTGSSKSISYIPDTGYYGNDSFVVGVSDGYGGTDYITVNVTINAVPVAGFGYALNFDGTNEYVDMGDNASLIVGNQFTEEAWIYPTDTGDSQYHGFLGYQPENTFDRPPSLWSYDKKKIHGGFGDSTVWNAWITNEDVLIFDTWNHIAATFDGITYKLYVNGNMVGIGIGDYSGKIPAPTPIRYIGRVDNYFKGGIDEVRIWDTAISETNIKSWMNRDITSNHPDYNNLLGYWQFNQTFGTVSDDSKNSNDGTLLNMESNDWTVSTIPNRYFVKEGESVNIYLIGYDYNNDDLTFEIVNGPSNGSLTGTGSELTYTHNAGETTSDIITYKVKDYESTSINTAEIEIIVIPVNDNPIITHQGNLSVDEGVSMDLPDVIFTDAESTDTHRAEVYYTENVATNYGNISSPFDIGSKIFSSDGTYPITVKVFDDNGGSDTITYNVVVSDTVPTAALTGSSILNEGSVGNFDASGSSGYDVPLTFEWDWDYDGSFTASLDTGSTTTHTWINNGDYTVAVKVKDNDGSTSIDTISVTVNDLGPSADFIFTDSPKEGQNIIFTDLSISIPDSIISWDWDLNGDGAIDSNLQNPETIYGNEGTFNVTLNITDSDGSIDSINHVITIGNVAPIIDNSTKSGIEDDTLTFSKADFTDNYNDVIVDELSKIKITGLPEHGILLVNETTININDEIESTSLSAITYVPYENWNGSTVFEWQASDGVDYSLKGTVTINISPVNDALVNTTEPSYIGTMHNGKTLTIDNGSWNDDIDGNPADSISFAYQWQRSDDASATNIVSIDGATESTYDLTINDNDKYIRAAVTGTDSGTPGNENLTLYTEWKEVLNEAPVISSGASITVNMSEDGNPAPFSLTLNATDTDSDVISWSISSQAINGTAVATGMGTSKVISYTPDSDYNGLDSFMVAINDGNGGTDSIIVNIVIDSVNDAPENTTLPSFTGTMHNGQILTAIPGVWNDSKDNNAIDTISYAYQWQKSIDSSSSDFVDITNATDSAYTLTVDDNDEYIRVKVTATDSGTPGTKTTNAFSIWKVVLNNSPVISQGNEININVDEDDESFNFILDASDSDEDIITWTFSSLPENGTSLFNKSISGISQEISYIPNANYYGNDSLQIIVSDVNGGSNTILINITVKSINDLPIITPSNTIYVYENETIPPFEISFSDVETADTHTGRIDWSDGSAVVNLGTINSPFITTEHTYTSEGSYEAKVKVRDNNGGETVSTILIVVRERYSEPVVDLVFGGEINNKTTLVNTDHENGYIITNVQFRNDNINKLLSNIPNSSNILLPVEDLQSSQINSILNGQLVKNLETKDVSLEIQTMRATYILPVNEINIDEVAKQFGENINLEEIQISIRIGEASLKDTDKINNYEINGKMELIIEPISFEIVATYGMKEINISDFGSYVERMIPLSNDNDIDKITTAVVLDKFGNLLHVPTKIININGRYYAKVSSLTNSTYTLIWNPIEFDDVNNHWSKEAVNDMGSRLIASGYSAGVYKPDQSITRAEFISIIVKALGLRNSNENITFTDVQDVDWYYDSLSIAKEYMLIDGYKDGSFKPNNEISRQEAMSIISNTMDILKLSSELTDNGITQTLNMFEDSEALSNWAKVSAANCIENQIFTGFNNRLSPKSNITRSETATIIRRLLIKAGLI